MAWTAPATATVGQLMTAAFWNQQVRDNEAYLKSHAVDVLKGSGSGSVAGSGGQTVVSVSFSPAFLSTPVMIVNVWYGDNSTYANINPWAGSVSTTGGNVNILCQAAISVNYAWMASAAA